MRNTKKFINAVEEDLAKSNLQYSRIWSIAEKKNYIGNMTSKTYAAIVYLYDRIYSEPVYRIYYNFDVSMGNKVDYVTRKTIEDANNEFAKSLI